MSSSGASDRGSPDGPSDDCLEQQFAELQLLINMYDANELVFQSVRDVHTGRDTVNIRALLETCEQDAFKRLAVSDGIEFVLTLQIHVPESSAGTKKKVAEATVAVELTVHLDPMYPVVPPQLFIRLPSLPSCQVRPLRQAAQTFIDEQADHASPMLVEFVQWLHDQAPTHLNVNTDQPSAEAAKRSGPIKLQRLWVYSHHIYSETKRRNLLAFAEELNLGGFCLSGKPGVICFEGSRKDCQEYYHRIRRWQWRKLELRETENCEEKKNPDQIENFCKFQGRFQEIQLKMKEFKQYLRDKDLEFAFNMLFGFEKEIQ